MTRPIDRLSRSLKVRVGRNAGSIAQRAKRVRARGFDDWPRLGRAEVLIFIAVAVVLIVGVGIAFDRVSVARSRALPGFITQIFEFISYLGKSQWELYPLGIVVIVLALGRWDVVPRFVRVFWTEIGALAAYFFVAIGGAGLIVNLVKQPIGRGRPVTFDEFGPLTLHPFSFDYAFQSFPSGHSTTAGAIIAIGFLVFRRQKIGLLLFGLAIGASRVVVGAHYPSDVLAGLLLGFFFSCWLAESLARYGWAFAREPTGTIRARVAGIRYGFGSRARIAVAMAGLVDALAGRPLWVPALASIGGGSDGDSRVRRDRLDEV